MIKDLKVNGSSSIVKVVTKVTKIRPFDGDQDIDCKIAGIASVGSNSEFVKEAGFLSPNAIKNGRSE